MLNTLFGLLESYGYPIVLAAAALENTFLVGMFVPGQAIVLAAGLASRFSDLNPIYVAGLAAVGEVTGNAISIAIGRHAGPTLFDRWGDWFERHGADLEKAQEYVRERGAAALLLGRPAWGIKNLIPAIVGASDMSWWKALLYVLVASVVYYPALVGLGWLLGLGVRQAASLATWFGVAVTALLLIAVGVAVWRMRKRSQGSNQRVGQ